VPIRGTGRSAPLTCPDIPPSTPLAESLLPKVAPKVRKDRKDRKPLLANSALLKLAVKTTVPKLLVLLANKANKPTRNPPGEAMAVSTTVSVLVSAMVLAILVLVMALATSVVLVLVMALATSEATVLVLAMALVTSVLAMVLDSTVLVSAMAMVTETVSTETVLVLAALEATVLVTATVSTETASAMVASSIKHHQNDSMIAEASPSLSAQTS